MAKTEVEIRFTFPLDEILLQHKGRAERKAAVYSGSQSESVIESDKVPC